MFYPKQIPYLLNEDFKRNVEYQEFHYQELEEFCMCIWQMKSKHCLNTPLYNHILPDACIDIIVNFITQEIFIVGFSSATVPLELKGDIDYLGVRLKPGAFYSLFKVPADEIMDKGISFKELEKEYNLEPILKEKDSQKRRELLKAYLITKIRTAKDKYYIDFVNKLYHSPNDQTVLDIAKTFNYTKRHINRIFKTNYGLSPKVLLNILRLHLCLTLILDENMELINVATICGFYDQSHFIKEIKKYTGISPLGLLESYKK